MNNNINDKLVIKQKELTLEKDPTKRAILQKELQILNFRKQIDFYKNKINQIRNSMN